MTEKYLGVAVKHCLDRIAICQQNIAAMYEINRRMGNSDARRINTNMDSAEARGAQNLYWMILHEQLVSAWNDLAMFAPISKKALDYLRMRTETWFDRDDTDVMRYLGFYGGYYTEDKDKFRAEVLSMFGIERTEGADEI